MERRASFLDRLRDWLSGRRTFKHKKPPHPGVFNQPAPADRAGDTPILTSHGPGPSQAH